MATQTPGWYPDPDNGSQQRYWDGHQWTDNYSPYATPQPAAQPAQQVTPQTRRGNLVVLALVAVAVVVGVVAAVRMNSAQDAAEPQVTPEPFNPADYCDPAQPKGLEQLGRGANGGNMKLTNGWSVQSMDYRQVYFVAARMPAGEVVVFKVNSDPSDLPPGASLKAQAESINEIAHDNFVYPFGPDQNAPGGGASMDDDGAQEAYDCANAD